MDWIGGCGVGGDSNCGIGTGGRFPKKTGIQSPGIQHAMEELPKAATIAVKGDPDWLAATSDAIWLTSERTDSVVRLDAATNQPGMVVTVNKPCSGLAVGFGSLWVPSCGDKSVVRVDPMTGAVQATIPAGPADSEGGITTGAGSVWLVTSAKDAEGDGELTRIDAATNKVVATIKIPAGSFNPLFAEGSVWVTSNAGNVLVRVDPATNKVVSSTAVGPMPRFLAYGAGSIWVLNQGDGTVSRVNAKTGKLEANDCCGNSGARRRDYVWRGIGVGYGDGVSADADRCEDEQGCGAVAWCWRRQRALCVWVGLADRFEGREGVADSRS